MRPAKAHNMDFFFFFSRVAFQMLNHWVEDCRRNGDSEDSIKERIAKALIKADLANVAINFGLIQPVEQQPVTYTDPETGSRETQV